MATAASFTETNHDTYTQLDIVSASDGSGTGYGRVKEGNFIEKIVLAHGTMAGGTLTVTDEMGGEQILAVTPSADGTTYPRRVVDKNDGTTATTIWGKFFVPERFKVVLAGTGNAATATLKVVFSKNGLQG